MNLVTFFNDKSDNEIMYSSFSMQESCSLDFNIARFESFVNNELGFIGPIHAHTTLEVDFAKKNSGGYIILHEVEMEIFTSDENNIIMQDVDDMSSLLDDQVMHSNENLRNKIPPFLVDNAMEIEELYGHDISNYVDTSKISYMCTEKLEDEIKDSIGGCEFRVDCDCAYEEDTNFGVS